MIPTDFHIFQRGWYTTNQIQKNLGWSRLSSLWSACCFPLRWRPGDGSCVARSAFWTEVNRSLEMVAFFSAGNTQVGATMGSMGVSGCFTRFLQGPPSISAAQQQPVARTCCGSGKWHPQWHLGNMSCRWHPPGEILWSFGLFLYRRYHKVGPPR